MCTKNLTLFFLGSNRRRKVSYGLGIAFSKRRKVSYRLGIAFSKRMIYSMGSLTPNLVANVQSM